MITFVSSILLSLPLEVQADALQTAQRKGPSLPELFMMVGPFWMSLLTILLVGMLFAAWKAPRWVKEIGLAAPIVAFLSVLFGLYNAFDALQQTEGAISPVIVFAGLKISTVAIIYGLLIYLLSLVLRIIRKPRI